MSANQEELQRLREENLVLRRRLQAVEGERLPAGFAERAMESSLAGVAFADLQWRLTYANPAYLRMWGLDSMEEALGRPNSEFAEFPAEVEQLMEALARDGAWFGELMARRADGSRFPVELSASVVRDVDGAVQGYMASFRDVSELRRALEQARRSEERLRTYVDNSPVAVFVADREGRYVDANPAACRMLGYSRDELLALSIADVSVREEEVDPMAAFEELKDQGRMSREMVLQRKDGSSVPVRLEAVALHGGRFMGQCVDITEAKERTRQLQVANFALDSATIGVSMADLEGRHAYCNEAFLRMWGFQDESEILGRPIMETWRDQGVVEQALQVAMSSGVFKGEMVARRVDGSTFDAYVEGHLVRDEQGAPVCLMAFIMDITRRKRREAELASLLDELRRSNEDLQQFAYVASHDLQEPLRVIAGFTQLLARRYQGRIDQDADDFIGYVVDGVERMQGLIEDLLAYSRVHTQGRTPAPVDLNEVAARTLDALSRSFEESEAHVVLEELPTVPADDRQLGQLFQNLLHNAVKFRGERPLEIRVSCRPEPGGWMVEVRDNGLGVDPEYAGKVFDVFKRLHSRNDYPGTGIGLAICKRIVERHGGRIWVEPAEGGGSAFRFTLPAEAAGRQEHCEDDS
jgi:PAS domain S-box-containing protein